MWRFCGLLLSFYGYVSAPQGSSRLLSKELLSCPPKELLSCPLLSSKVPRENSFRLFSSEKKFPYAWILSFIYKAVHSLWNILFPFFLHARRYGVSIMWGSLGDFPKDAAVSCLVSDQIPFNLFSICSRMCLGRDLPIFYMQLRFLPSFPIWSWSPLLDGSKSHAK